MNTQIHAIHDQEEPLPRAKGEIPWVGHLLSLLKNPKKWAQRLAEAHGEIVLFTLLGKDNVLLTGEEASELFYFTSEEQLDQSAAYTKLMTPILGQGVLYDTSTERKNEQLRVISPALRIEAMRGYSHTIVKEVKAMIADWGEQGEIDLVEFMRQLTINASSHCLLGKEFRCEWSGEFARAYRDLRQGFTPLAHFFPHLPIARFKRRDQARHQLQELVSSIIKRRSSREEKASDLLQFLIDTPYKDGTPLSKNEIAGLLIGSAIGGHDTSVGAGAWVLLELLKHPYSLRKTCAELDLLPDEVTFDALRDMSYLENVVKEALRLHPPIPILMRKALQDLHFKRYTIKAGTMLWACPAVTHRMTRLFTHPQVFDPDRFSQSRKEGRTLAYQPFGGGRHKCPGNVFAMFQLKAIFAVLLRRYEFELVSSPETYMDDYASAIVLPRTPCLVRYRRRTSRQQTTEPLGLATDQIKTEGCPLHTR